MIGQSQHSPYRIDQSETTVQVVVTDTFSMAAERVKQNFFDKIMEIDDKIAKKSDKEDILKENSEEETINIKTSKYCMDVYYVDNHSG